METPIEAEDRKERMNINQDSSVLADSWSVLHEVSGMECRLAREHRLGPH